MIPQHATHIAIDRADGDHKSYYQIPYGDKPDEKIMVWDSHNQQWAESCYESEAEMQGDGIELIEL